jgi:hypothetical protein
MQRSAAGAPDSSPLLLPRTKHVSVFIPNPAAAARRVRRKFQSFAAKARAAAQSPGSLLPHLRQESVSGEGSLPLSLPVDDQGLPHPVTGRLPGGGNDFAEVGGGSLVLQSSAATPAMAPTAAGVGPGLLPPNPLDGVVAVANGFGNVARDAVTQAGAAAGQINNRLGAAAGGMGPVSVGFASHAAACKGVKSLPETRVFCV